MAVLSQTLVAALYWRIFTELFCFAQPACLLRDVPEKSEGFPLGTLCRSLRAAIICGFLNLAGCARRGNPSAFSDLSRSGWWCLVDGCM